MAQIVTNSWIEQSDASNIKAWFSEQLSALHGFEDVQTDQQTGDILLYFTASSYIRLSSTTTSGYFTVSVTCPGHTAILYDVNIANRPIYAEIVKSVLGDISIRFGNNAPLENHDFFVGVLLKCKNTITGVETWGFYQPQNMSSTSAQAFTPRLLITDDTTYENGQRLNTFKPSPNSASAVIVCSGYNPYAAITVLVPICAVSSCCVAVNTYFMLISPQMYDGDATLDGKHYHCIGLVAMLDEVVE